MLDVMEKQVKKESTPKQWTVIKRFYDLEKQRIVEVGEVVNHTKKREDLKLIEKK